MAGIVIDIGTGDGRFAYELAKENPDKLIIGIDPYHKGLEEISRKTVKKPAKGGVPNALYILAGIKDAPEELDGIANQIFIILPWGSLLEDVVKAEKQAWDRIKKLCRPGAIIDLVFGYNGTFEKNKTVERDLPTLNENYFQTVLVPALESYGFNVEVFEKIANEELKEIPSSWAKRLAYGKQREFFHLTLRMV